MLSYVLQYEDLSSSSGHRRLLRRCSQEDSQNIHVSSFKVCTCPAFLQNQAHMYPSCCRERKREADAGDLPSETPDAKRLKTSAEVPPDQEARLPVVTADSAGPVPVDTELETSTVKANSKKKVKDGGSFKENPYTFLSPDDPILRSCM